MSAASSISSRARRNTSTHVDRSSYTEAIQFFWEKNFGLQAPWDRFRTQFEKELRKTFGDNKVDSILPVQWCCFRLMLTGSPTGGLVPCDAAIKLCERLGSYEDANFIERTFLLISKPYFFGDISKDETEALLKRVHNDGAYCVRFTSSSPLALAVSVYQDGSVKHYRALYTQGKGFHTGHTCYPTLTGLLERKAGLLNLEFPCPFSPYAKILETLGTSAPPRPSSRVPDGGDGGLISSSDGWIAPNPDGGDATSPPKGGSAISADAAAAHPTLEKDQSIESLRREAAGLSNSAWGVQRQAQPKATERTADAGEMHELVNMLMAKKESASGDSPSRSATTSSSLGSSALKTSGGAEALHGSSSPSSGPMVDLNVVLFGHERRTISLNSSVLAKPVSDIVGVIAEKCALAFPSEIALGVPLDQVKKSKGGKSDAKVRWLSTMKTLGEQDVQPSERFVVRRRYFQNGRAYVVGAAKDNFPLEPFYKEMNSFVLSGEWRPTLNEALNLAATQCQIDHGDYAERHLAAMNSGRLVCSEYVDDLEGSINPVVDRWIVLKGMSKVAAMMRYIQLVVEMPFFGVSFFRVKHIARPKTKRKLLPGSLGVGLSGVHLKTSAMPAEGILTHQLNHLYRWAPSPKGLVLDFGCHSTGYVKLLTNDADQIVLLIEEHLAREGLVYEGPIAAEDEKSSMPPPSLQLATTAAAMTNGGAASPTSPHHVAQSVEDPTPPAAPKEWNSRDRFASAGEIPVALRRNSAVKKKVLHGLLGKKGKGKKKKNQNTFRSTRNHQDDGPGGAATSPQPSPGTEGRPSPFSHKRKSSKGKDTSSAIKPASVSPSPSTPPPPKKEEKRVVLTREYLGTLSLDKLVELCDADTTKHVRVFIIDELLKAQASKNDDAPENRCPVCLVRGTHNFKGEADHELNFRKSQVIMVFDEDQSGWYLAEIDGKRGYVPNTYVTQLSGAEVAKLVKEKKHEAIASFEALSLRPDFVALTSLCYCIESAGEKRDNVVKLALDFLASKGMEYAFMEKLIDAEVMGTGEATTLFRTNTVTAVILRVHALMVGTSFLRRLLSPPVQFLVDFIEKGNSVEMDKHMLEPDENLHENALRLACLVNHFMARIAALATDFPSPIKRIGSFLRKRVGARFGESSEKALDSALAGYIFLRFVCPAIVTPSKYGIVDVPLKTKSRRALLLVTRVLQCWANGVAFKPHDQLAPLNLLISTMCDKRTLFSAIVKSNASASSSEEASSEKNGGSEAMEFTRNHMKSLCSNFVEHFNKMTRNASDNTKYLMHGTDEETVDEVHRELEDAVRKMKYAKRIQPLAKSLGRS